MENKLSKTCNPADYEKEIYQKWESSGYFNPDNLDLPKDAKPYTVVLPPPNITDKLHMGHSAMLAIEDLLIRYHRMKGFHALWIPGTDHAAIATQNVVEKKLLKETGKTRHDLGREKFLKEVWQFLRETQAVILNQTRRMGSSLDWSREAFTLDKQRGRAVKKMFIDMYQAGVIYRGERIVNWCPRCHSTLADDEVEYREEKARLYWIKYGPFVLATTRPETKLGDTAVAVYPNDKRYKKMIGKKYKIPSVLGEFEIIVVADKSVDPNFGSGAIKVTPAHSFIDNEIAQKNNLPMKKIINENGRMMENCGKYAGLTTLEARKAIVKDMEEMELIDHIDENYQHSTAQCYRCGTIIEPLPSKQWFVNVDKKLERFGGKSLKEKAIEVAENEKIKFIPERFGKRYLDWMENLHDWCISRQIWFGHEIPAYYKDKEIYVGEEKPEGKDWKQDSDSLDTWFSSGMWTFSTLNWPNDFNNNEKTGDLARFHPTQVLETGYDILTLWVSRMIMMTLFALDEVPFEKVYLHGLVLDKSGKKMSKSKGNGIDPIDMIEKYGADATRLSLLIGSSPGNDIRLFEEKIEGQRNFINKLWNISRFIISNHKFKNINQQIAYDKLTMSDTWILKEMGGLINEVNNNLKTYNFSSAGEKLREFTWNKFADWYLEISKFEENKETKTVILNKILKDLLKLWHPFTPFVTEKIYNQIMPEKILMVEKFPNANEYILKENASPINFKTIKEIISVIRVARAEYKITPSQKIKVIIYSKKFKKGISSQEHLIKKLGTNIETLKIKESGAKIARAFYKNLPGIEIYIPLENIIDTKKEKKRLEKELLQSEKFSVLSEKKLKNKKFVKNAPKEIVEKENKKMMFQKKKTAEIKKQLKNLE